MIRRALERRRRAAEQLVLQHLTAGQWTHGWDLSRRCGLRGGRFYPAARRLEAAGLVEARWEDGASKSRYRRRLYRRVAG